MALQKNQLVIYLLPFTLFGLPLPYPLVPTTLGAWAWAMAARAMVLRLVLLRIVRGVSTNKTDD